jgi:hypothetical protein
MSQVAVGASQDEGILLCVSQEQITRPAKQPSHKSGGFVMVDIKSAPREDAELVLHLGHRELRLAYLARDSLVFEEPFNGLEIIDVISSVITVSIGLVDNIGRDSFEISNCFQQYARPRADFLGQKKVAPVVEDAPENLLSRQ